MLTTQTGTPEAAPKVEQVKQKKKPGPKPKQAVMSGRKAENKDIRQPLGEETSPHKMREGDQVRPMLGKQMKHDWAHYRRMAQYDGFTLFGCLDDEVDAWFNEGAEPVRKAAKAKKIFKGLNDTADSEWEYVVVGKDEGGNAIKCYLLFISDEDYYKVKIQPLEVRNQAIRDAMGMGLLNNNGEGKVMGHIGGLQTYAPMVDGEHRGITTTIQTSREKEQEMTHDA